jgi:hypothetical protein
VRLPQPIDEETATRLSETIARRLTFIGCSLIDTAYFDPRTMLRIYVGDSDRPICQASFGAITRRRRPNESAILEGKLMPKNPCTFRKTDVRRAISAATDAGIRIAGLEFTPDGKIVLVTADVAREARDAHAGVLMNAGNRQQITSPMPDREMRRQGL